MNAQENPLSYCQSVVGSNFWLLGTAEKDSICKGIATDAAKGQEDMCGFIIVSAFEAYNRFYQELEEDLA